MTSSPSLECQSLGIATATLAKSRRMVHQRIVTRDPLPDQPQGPRRYRVSRKRRPLLDFMLQSLRESGCRILSCSSADLGPFVFTFETPEGDRHGVVAYAFTATRTPTAERPVDERSFQIKYGSKPNPADNLHALWRDPGCLYTTLLLGIDVASGFFVAADPEAHNPTKFFIRLEFKDRHAEAIRDKGWHAWERDRRGSSEPIETLVGGTSDRFLDLVLFERAAVGLPPGDRHLLAERPTMFARAAVEDEDAAAAHPLALEFGLAPHQIMELIASAKRLKMAVRGWVAEEKLRDVLAGVPGVTHCERLDAEGGPDLSVRWRDGPPILIECKNVLRKTTAAGLPRIDLQRTRASKADPCSRYYMPSDFDVIAGCLHAVTENWEFSYVLPGRLEHHARCPGRISNNVRIDDAWTRDPGACFEAVYAQRGEKA